MSNILGLSHQVNCHIRTFNHPALRSSTDENRDDGEEDEPPSWNDGPSCDRDGEGRSRKIYHGRRRREASMSRSLYSPLLAVFIFIVAFALLGPSSNFLCAASKDLVARPASDSLSVDSLDSIAADLHLITSSDELDESQHIQFRPRDQYCSFECCISFMNPLDLVDRNQLRGSANTRILQAATEKNASNPCPTETPEAASSGMPIPPGLQYTFIIVLLSLSAIFSGLTLGLLSLDLSGLEIVMAAEDASMARAARAIYPVRKNGNLLLCTLLLGNVAVNSLLSILMADITTGLVGFFASTFSIVIFGEIIPQAVCSRFPLQVGEKAVPIVKVFIVLLAVVAYPLAFILNKVLGREIGTTYSQSEMAKLIELHVQGGHFDHETGAAMTGALRYHGMSVKDAMTPLKNTFMLGADERLGFDTVAKIFKTGYSRIPVYEVTKSNVIGLLFVKDLIFLDPEDEIPVRNFVQIFGRGLHIVWPEDKLGNVLKLLKQGRSHMALVRDVNHGDGTLDPFYEIKGIITLEDIIEIILGDEIVDETDELVEVNDPESLPQRSGHMGEFISGVLENADNESNTDETKGRVSRWKMSSSQGIDWESRLRLLDERLVDEHLSPDEVRAVAAHLKTNYPKAVELISDKQLKGLLASVPVTEIRPAQTCASDECDDDACNWIPTDPAEFLYERGVPADFCTLVLTGKLTVMSGADKFRSDVSNWGVLGTRALTDPSYVPDFSAWVVPTPHGTSGCRCIKLDRGSFFHAVDNTALEKTGRAVIDMNTSSHLSSHEQSQNGDPKPYNGSPPSPGRTTVVNNIKPSSDLAEPEIPPDSVDPAHPPYVIPEDQKIIHKRRSKLLHAFIHSKKQESSDE
ncbi:hypothetical protein HJC23_013891 [Cyclotella cryptica]|uniref:CNNM transmembrane domain-containing protein n=1 Tax=Cyclotella cryptica TaxID=29204 RepID=A0ABD3QIV1_9STRA|eukprot:CCRYP_005477-RA/>CCRYP_005477-RA protein AED:0.36 eAED:0.36 QI:286/1/1/1/0.5/0.33/3/1015/860